MILKSPQEEEAVRRMQKIYLDAERKIVAEITRKRTLGYVDYAEVAALERVQAILTQMQNETFEYAPIMVETIFHGQGEKNAEGYANARALTTTETAIVQTLVNNLLGEVLEVSQTAYQSAKDYLAVGRLEADELREAALESVANQQAAGYSWTMAQKQMTAELVGKGVTGFVDKAGRKWSLTDYCNMAVRTTAKQAAVASILARDDHDLWQIVRIGSTCPVCAVYEGRIYSKSGTNPDYPPLASAFGKIDPEGANNLENTYLNIHPN
jgi:NADH dehydrogenase/NADH:ubiquinone oxidoreductase subunit G